ncbi:potassium-transporting ATPase subunit C [Streptomyces sp. NPDC002012]|uniref:potassium-transporting ATPase subunit C n=1 Tax=Streptomyces sp. NPDC002012 TaxID=3154532 RepID=UPI003324BF43
MARGSLTDKQWVRLEALLPELPVMGRKPRDRRQVFDGIWWRARTGSPWRDVPERYGPWETAYSVFRRWQIDGTWARILKKLQTNVTAHSRVRPGRTVTNGSLLTTNGTPVASSLIGQNFALPKKNPRDAKEPLRPDPKWFQPRPSAGGYDPTIPGASNLGPNNTDLIKTVRDRRSAVAAFDGVPPESVPADAVTAGGSGLDPAISPAYAYEQVDRVAKARHLAPAEVKRLVAHHVQGRVLGFLGQERVNVVELNHDLARLM